MIKYVSLLFIGQIAFQQDKEGSPDIGSPDEFRKLFALIFSVSAVALYRAGRDSQRSEALMALSVGQHKPGGIDGSRGCTAGGEKSGRL